MPQANAEIVNKLGLHARASAKLTQLASSYPCEIWLSRNARRVNAKSIMGVMMLAAGKGATVTLETQGDKADEARSAGAEYVGDDDLAEKILAGWTDFDVAIATPDMMKSVGAVFSGEGNGGPIDPRVGYVRDSFVGMALVLDAMSARDATLSQLVAEIPRYAIHKAKLELPREKIAPALEALAKSFPGAEVNRMDGVRLDWPGKWLLVRASNTEPIVRLISEAPTPTESATLCEQAEAVMRDRS